jgi:RecA/RadA recombinase
MENERKAKLLATLKEFNKEQKEEVFTLGNEIEDLPVIPSGIALFDDFIGGGFKKGTHTIIHGPYSVGKTAIILQTIKNAQQNGNLVCFCNTEKPIDKERFKFFGVNLDELVYIEAPNNAEQCLEAMRRLCREKVIDLFVIDSVTGLSPKSVQEEASGKERSLEKKNVAALPLVLSNFYNIVNSYVFRSKASVIWSAQQRIQGIGSYFVHMGLSGGSAQKYYAYQIISMRHDQKSNAPVNKIKEYFLDPEKKVRFHTTTEPNGFGVVIKLEKTNSCKSKKENSELSIPFIYSQGFVSEIKEETDLPVVIDAKNDEERKLIEAYVIEKKQEDAIKLGLIKEELKKEDLVQVQEEVPIAVEEPKKKRGRKKGSTNGEKN